MNQPLAKQPPMWGLCWCAIWKGTFTYCPRRLNMPLSWLDRKLDTIFDPAPFLPTCSNRKWNSATHNRWRHLSLVGQTYLLLLVSSTLWTIWSFYNCLLKWNHFIRAEMQVLKCCCWWGTNAGTSVTVPLCSHVTAHIHRKKWHRNKAHKRLYKIQDIWEVWATQIKFAKAKLQRPRSSMWQNWTALLSI